MSKKAVVIRHLKDSRPVASAIIEESNSYVDDMEHYLISEARTHIKDFLNRFPEFKTADWYIDVLNSSNGIITTEVVDVKKL